MKTTYKAIIKNLVQNKVNNYLEKKNAKYFYVKEIELKQSNDFDYPSFDAFVKMEWHEYKLHGYINEYGQVSVTSLQFEDKYYKNDEDRENNIVTTESYFLYGTNLKDFTF